MKIIKKIEKIVLILLVILVIGYILIYYYSVWRNKNQVARLTSPQTNQELAQIYTATVGKVDSISSDSITIIRQDDLKSEKYNIDQNTKILKTAGNGEAMVTTVKEDLKKDTAVVVVIPKGNIKLVFAKEIHILTGVEL